LQRCLKGVAARSRQGGGGVQTILIEIDLSYYWRCHEGNEAEMRGLHIADQTVLQSDIDSSVGLKMRNRGA
jgi:hypothetical protein